ncbi:MAG: HEAT repeat domain-containing protein [Scytonematopsis contorta HA4267-MV1]|jgi:HEAT repeat protein|nr:HEAT repeat domain-containing protein [Scytonematopsis contorta HA4267-MV1]
MANLLKLKLALSQSQKLTAKIVIALFCVSSPLLVTNSSLAQNTRRVNNETKVISQNQKASNLNDFKNINDVLRKYSAKNTSNYEKSQAINTLQDYLKKPDKQLQIAAVKALDAIGTGADAALPDLKNLLKKEQDKGLLSSVINAINSIDAKPAIKELIDIFQDQKQDLEVRSLAARALGSVGNEKEVKPVIPYLLYSLEKDQGLNKINLRINVAEALSKMYSHLLEDSQAVPVLTKALQDPSWRVRRFVFSTLRPMGSYSKDAVPQIIKAYRKEDNLDGRERAVYALGEIGKSLNTESLKKEEILPLLVEILKDKDKQNSQVRDYAAQGINNIAGSFLEEIAKSNKLQNQDANYFIKHLDEALLNLNSLEALEKRNLRTTIQNINYRVKELQQRQLVNQIFKNPYFWLITTYLIALSAIFTLRPVLLLKFDKALKSVGSFKLPVVDKEISLSWLLLMLKYHPRVLDAWVQEYIKPVEEAFQQKDTVKDRGVYIPIPVIQNGKNIAQLTNKELSSTFNKKQARLLIQGEGGVGKTSLACQIAKWGMSEDKNERLCKHRMLPVLIEDELVIEEEVEFKDGVATKKSPYIPALIKAIRGQLQYLTDETELISEELLEHLLRERRILVIVDHLSEMNEETRKAIRPDSTDFAVNALIVTSRSDEKLGGVNKTIINPMRIQGNRLSSFMEAYLTQANKRDLFTDPEFFQACSRLSQMVGERNVTALLAKLYADQLISAKLEEVQQLTLTTPDNIPDLMLWYLNLVNRSINEDKKLSDRTVHQDAKTIAWECLKENLKPTYAKRNVALLALGGDDAESRLNYLEKNLNLIQTSGAEQNKIRFALDPLAEYLAAIYLLELCQKNQYLWKEFWHQQKAVQDTSESMTGFLLALQDCYQALSKEANIPQYISEELSQLLDNLSTNTKTVSQMTLIQNSTVIQHMG